MPFDGSPDENATQHGFHIHRYRLSRSGLNPKDEILTIYDLVKLYKKVQPDILHHVAMKAVLYGSIAARIADIDKTVNLFPGLGYLFTHKSLKIKILKRIFFRVFRTVIARQKSYLVFQNYIDRKIFTTLGKMPKEQCVMIPGSGIDVDKYPFVPENNKGPVRIVLPARMLRTKGVYEFVEAARILKKQKLNAEFILAGDPDPKNRDSIPIEQLQEWNKEGVVKWIGWQEDLGKLFSECNIVCLPSYREGLPKVLLEAGACGRAVVTTDVPGCSEVIKDEDNGLLAPKQSAVKLAKITKKLITNYNLRQPMGLKGRKIVLKKYTSNQIIKANLDLYISLLTNNQIGFSYSQEEPARTITNHRPTQ